MLAFSVPFNEIKVSVLITVQHLLKVKARNEEMKRHLCQREEMEPLLFADDMIA